MSKPSPWALPAEIARFLRLEPKDVATLIKSDGLPVTNIPRKTRTVERIWMPAFHKWLLTSSRNPGALTDYQAFLAEFEPYRTPSRKKAA